MAHEINVTSTTKNNELVNMENIRRNVNFENLTDAEMETVVITAQQEVFRRFRNENKRNEKKIERLTQRSLEQHEWTKKQIKESKTFDKETVYEISAIKKENAVTKKINDAQLKLLHDKTENVESLVNTVLTVDAEQSKAILLKCHARGLYLYNGGYFNNSRYDTENKAKRFARQSLLDHFKAKHEKNILLKDYHSALTFADSWLPKVKN
jgi:hypothetical protein